MTAFDAHRNYMKSLDALSTEDAKKLIEENAMTPALLIDISQSLALQTDAIAKIAVLLEKALEGDCDEKRKTDQDPC